MNAAPHVVLVGLSHKTASVSLRERLAFRAEELPETLKQLLGGGVCQEAVLLSTCNRVELYAVGESAPSTLEAALRELFRTMRGVSEQELADALFVRVNEEAIAHLFEVTSSIDSQIMGETEILGQTRKAFRISAESDAAGSHLRRIFERAFFLAKELRSDGGIGQARASVSSAAVKLAENFFDDLAKRTVLVVGTGEMAAGMVRSLRAAGCKDVMVCSRTQARAEAFAAAEGGTACRIADLEKHLVKADIVLVSTAAPKYIISTEGVQAAQHARHGRPLFFVDISVPRNVDPVIQQCEDIYVFDIDDLENVAKEGRRLREQVAARWRPRLAREAERVYRHVRSSAPADAAKFLLNRANELRESELDALRIGQELDQEIAEKVAAAMNRFQSRLLHGPLAALKQATRNGKGDEAARWIEMMFKGTPRGSGIRKAVSGEENQDEEACDPERGP